jgi:putative intracellular protease/amidase
MIHRRSLALTLLLGLAMLGAAVNGARSAKDEPKNFVCPPCGLPCDGTVYHEPGSCPKCGMTLVDEETAKAMSAKTKKVGILLFDGVQIIDYTGPYEVFQAAGFDVYTVAATKDPIATVAGMRVVPKFGFDDAPQPDILVVPGGGIAGALASDPTLAWVKAVSAKAERTLSVCNGAFILAKAGLLDGLTATTTSGNIPRLRSEYPKTRVVDDQRFVDNGKIVTAGGLTAGIDGALHVVAKTLGPGAAQEVALGEEYDWRPDGGFVRGALADMNLEPWIDSSLDDVGKWRLVSTQGGTARWQVVAEGTSTLTPTELTDRFGKTSTSQAKWKRLPDDAPSASGTTSHWAFTGRDGKPWKGTLTVQPKPGAAGELVVRLEIARAA